MSPSSIPSAWYTYGYGYEYGYGYRWEQSGQGYGYGYGDSGESDITLSYTIVYTTRVTGTFYGKLYANATLNDITKIYKLYDKPSSRLKEFLLKKPFHREFAALRNISFEVPDGKTVGIIGENGAGKSTLLKIFAGVLSPTQGTIDIKGRISSLLELGTGFHPEFNGIENIYFYGSLHGFSREDIKKKIDESRERSSDEAK